MRSGVRFPGKSGGGTRAPSIRLLPAVIGILVIVTVFAIAISTSLRGTSSLAGVEFGHGGKTQSAVVDENISYCSLLGASDGLNSTGYTANVSQIWSTLCKDSQFQSVVNSWGGLELVKVGNNSNYSWVAENLTFSTGAHGDSPPTLYFSVTYIGPCTNTTTADQICSVQIYWAGNVTTNGLSGPYTEESPVTELGGGTRSSPAPGVPAAAIYAGVAVVLGVILIGAIAAKTRRNHATKNPTPPVFANLLETDGGQGRSARGEGVGVESSPGMSVSQSQVDQDTLNDVV